MPRTHNHFTEAENQFLIKFIAERNFGPRRSGNQIFQTLTDNAQGAWPLADKHTWQSWRNRYVKDREWFDYKIEKYQKSHGILPSLRAPADKAAAAEKKKARHEKLLKSLKNLTTLKREEEEESADELVQDTESAREHEKENGKGKRKKPSEEGAGRRKKQKVSVEPVEIINVTSPEGHGKTAEPVRTAKVSEEGCGNDRELVQSKPQTAVAQESLKEPASPDNFLAEHSAEEENEVVGELSLSSADVPLAKAKLSQLRRVIPRPSMSPQPNHDSKPSEVGSADAFFQSIPSTPEHLQSPLAHRRPRELPRLIEGPFSHSFTDAKGRKRPRRADEDDHNDDDDDDDDDTEQEGDPESHEGEMNEEWPPLRLRSQAPDHESKGKAKAVEVSLKFDKQVQATIIPTNQKIEKPDQPTKPAARPSASTPQPPTLQHPFSQSFETLPPPPRHSDNDAKPSSSKVPPLNYDHPFGQPKEKLKEKPKEKPKTRSKDVRRQTFAGFTADGHLQIDLAATGTRPRGRVVQRSLPRLRPTPSIHSRGSSSLRSLVSNTDSGQTSTPPVSTNDRSLIYGEGLNTVIRKMSENHGFQERVTWRLWHHLGHIEAVDRKLRRMRQAAEDAAMETADEGETELGGWEARGFAAEVERRNRQERWSEPDEDLPTRPHVLSGHPLGLQFTPAPRGDDHDSVYSPPEASRAGQFARLVKEGRLREALRREGRKARHGGVSPGKALRIKALVSASELNGKPGVGRPVSPGRHDIAVADYEWGTPSPRAPVWGPKEDDLLRAAGEGDVIALQELETAMGKFAVRQRTAQMITSL